VYTKPADIAQLLTGHTTPETCVSTDSYPYGRLRATARWWVETRAKFGQRVMFQTINPKTGRENKPKAGNYSIICLLYKDSKGHVQNFAVHSHDFSTEAELDQFAADFAPALEGGDYADRLKYIRACIRANARITVKIHNPAEGPAQTLAEQAAMIQGAVRHEFRQINKEDAA
jgi:hypothetical protein